MNYPNLLCVILEGFLFNRLPFPAPDVPVAGQGEVLAMHAANTAFFFVLPDANTALEFAAPRISRLVYQGIW